MKAVFITHAGPQIGGGHLSRCFALSQALELQGVDCVWILNDESCAQANALGIENAVFLRNPFDGDVSAHLSGCRFVVVDSYEPPASFYKQLSKSTRIVAIDDLHDRGVEHFACVVINYGIGATRTLYADANSEFLLGPRYALLRREYWGLEPTLGDYILFIPGAADVLGSSEKIIEWWRPEWVPLVVVLGVLVPERRRVAAQERAEGCANVKVVMAPPNFAELLAGAGMVICSASVTAYEALAMQKRLAVFSVAPNQAGLGEALSRLVAAYDLGPWEQVVPKEIEKAMSFLPDRGALQNLVRKDGAVVCAEKLARLMED